MVHARRRMNPRVLSGLLTVVAMTPVLGAAPPHQPAYEPQPGDFTVVCTLFNGDDTPSLTIKDGIPVTYDPRILVGARIERVTFGKSPWPVGSVLNFVVHSPTLMLGGYGFSGKKYVMTFSPFVPKTERDLVWFEPNMRQILREIRRVEDGASGKAGKN